MPLDNFSRKDALLNFYSAERRSGAQPELAYERLEFYAKRLDKLFETGIKAGASRRASSGKGD